MVVIIHYLLKKRKYFAIVYVYAVYCSSRGIMKKTLYLFRLAVVLSFFVVPLVATTASAFSCGVDGNGKAIETSIDFGSFCNKPGAGPVTAMLLWAINFLAVGVGVGVVIGILVGGFMYARAEGNANLTQQGKDIITNSIIGLFLFIFLYAAANFFIPGGIFK